jgi:hypothetical protein
LLARRRRKEFPGNVKSNVKECYCHSNLHLYFPRDHAARVLYEDGAFSSRHKNDHYAFEFVSAEFTDRGPLP